ncbi:MAG: ABC transporter ATP-binding protein [Desulfobacterales bacterium]|jgi:cobalt/nickel transport system ATP-binding protein
MHSEAPLINLKDIKFSYPGDKVVLNHLDFEFYNGDRMGLIAPNGSGKTTFLHLIMGLNMPTSGHMELFGKTVTSAKDFAEARRRIGLLFQDPDDQLFSPTVIEDVAFGPLNLGHSRENALNIARHTLANLGLEGFEDRITFKLSGGEKRLVSLATVLAMEPDVLLLDEPLTGLDYDTASKIVEIISNLDQSCIIISHDIDFLLYTTSKICTIKRGKIIFEDEAQIHVHRHVHPHGRYPHKHE